MTTASHLFQLLSSEAQTKKSFIWENTTLSFNELLVGWNALRPKRGHYQISISLKIDDWSPWFPYAIWGSRNQRSFEHRHNSIKIFQDTISIGRGRIATGWRVKAEAKYGLNLQGFHALYASTPSAKKTFKNNFMQGSYICLEVPGLSQMSVRSSSNVRICSPTSSTAVIRFLKEESDLTPMGFANRVWDSHFDIYGHWVFAAAQAFVELGKDWETRAIYLNDFDDLYKILKSGYPVIVSVKGRLPGSLHPYDQGHLIVVRGFDPMKNRVLCMDPAFPKNSNTYMAYALDDFVVSWQRRKNIAYVFKRRFHRIDIPVR